MNSKVYWTTKDSRKIDVDKWEDLNHMRNVLKFLIIEREDYFDNTAPDYEDLQGTY